ncbi:hypothetical protein [Flavobacterium sp.]|jgi:hypothetical protein|uniref:hypothetical protein n=1 Tax=Flavobacterium sp. TaxID=239 RepID=UPI0026079A0C|nr:hypothetical protein [Flavobacterium sp.]
MDLLGILFITLASYFYLFRLKKRLSKVNYTNLLFIYFFHLLFGFYYYFFVFGDSIGYWSQAALLERETFYYCLTQQKGTLFIYAINYFPAKILGLSYFTGTMLYTFLGFIGMSNFYITCIQLIPKNPKFNTIHLFPLLFFLPNLHFWSCAVGKDTLLFLALGLIARSLLDFKAKWYLFAIGLLISYLVRPHISLFIIISLTGAIYFSKKTSFYQKVALFSIMGILFFLLFPKVMEFVKLEEASIDSFTNYTSIKAAKLGSANNSTAIDISNYPFLLKVFTFLFRPLPFDVTSFPTLLAAIENVFLLILFLVGFRFNYFSSIKAAPLSIKFSLLFFLAGSIVLSQSLGNLGIMLRMRNMFLPAIIFFLLWHYYYLNTKNRNSLQS